MKKRQLLTTLATSALILSTSGTVFADEITPVDPTAPTTDIIAPTDPVAPVEPPVEPTDPIETPTVPTNPTEPVDAQPETPTPSIEPTIPSITEPVDPKEDKPTTPDATEAKPEIPTPEPPKTADQAAQEGRPQEGTTSTVTGQVVQDVNANNPIYTNTGAAIVSTQNGQVVLSDGSMVAPESVGAVTNTDKTISVTKADGTKATLPHTGEATSLLSMIGAGLLGISAFIMKKKSEE
ncbi:LPXTG cell wall anchor domain-containing protein [Streptococcus dysgalactiae]|uniref:LPXTG cell wall anchor domain-containing protein n=1 Tax=Streptococcus dysgalactiae TaxID=1334 RepID=UPI001C943034|nr:LPXTG cell wall anchor domain-containing protein [Streptococcus gallolyticus]MBY5040642.1 LPXTG cell wall anchor domain-containing protein [Streptococcus gallolyticus]